MTVVELAIACLFVAGGFRSFLRWRGTDIEGPRAWERALLALHLTARIGMWMAFAGLFVGYALVDEPRQLGWFVLVPITLAALQLLSGLALWRSAQERSEGSRAEPAGRGSA